MNKEKTMKVYIGDVVTVVWSNGAGESDYRVVDTLDGVHNFELVGEREFGDDDGMTDDDFEAVFADIVARRGVAE
jgi:hypothetical protein